MKAQIKINHTCTECDTITVVIFESGDAATKLVHCGNCGKWAGVPFQEVEQDERSDKPKRGRKSAAR